MKYLLATIILLFALSAGMTALTSAQQETPSLTELQAQVDVLTASRADLERSLISLVAKYRETLQAMNACKAAKEAPTDAPMAQ